MEAPAPLKPSQDWRSRLVIRRGLKRKETKETGETLDHHQREREEGSDGGAVEAHREVRAWEDGSQILKGFLHK